MASYPLLFHGAFLAPPTGPLSSHWPCQGRTRPQIEPLLRPCFCSLAESVSKAFMTAAAEFLTIERVAVLQRVDLFAGVPGPVLVGVARALDEVRFSSGQPVIVRGALEDWLFIVATGLVRVHIGETTLAERGPGAIFGELAILSPAARSASVTAVEPSLLLRLRRQPFEELLNDRAEIGRAVIFGLARRLQELADRDATGAK